MSTPRKYTVDIPDALQHDLKQRLLATRWPTIPYPTQWTLGTDVAYLKDLTAYWCDGFSWPHIQAKINAYPNYQLTIRGHDIHYLHIRAGTAGALPVILTHGWPGSFLEFLKVIDLLTAQQEIALDLVVPSIPGFGFSSPICQPGGSSAYVAELWLELMRTLGYDRFVLQGGDIGAGISSWLALKHPEAVAAMHLNYIPGSYTPHQTSGGPVPDDMPAYKEKLGAWVSREGAYSFLQGTKPDSLAFGLNDSPAGLCAWIAEKFHGWSDHRGDLHQVISRDELLANISLYWYTGSIGSSIRMYSENVKAPLRLGADDFIKVPTALAAFPRELPTPPPGWIKKGYNLVRYTPMQAGGHFAALEQPALLARDLIAFLKSLR